MSKKAINITKEELYKLYVVDEKPMNVISSETNISVGKIYSLIHKFGIPSRPPHQGFKGKHHTDKTKQKIGDAHAGKIVSDETRKKIAESKTKGGIGHKKIRSDGYISIYFPDHPLSSIDGYIMEHDLVMECLIGRHLKDDECVHHINFVKDDNRKENLQLMTLAEHMSLHSKLRHQQNKENKYE